MAEYIYKTIKLNKVDSGTLYLTRYQMRADNVLAESIKRHGVLTPPVLTEHEPHQVISGYLRILGARSAGLIQVPALILKQSLYPRDCFLAAVLANLGAEWRDMDRCVVIRKAVDDFKLDHKEVIDVLLPILGLPSTSHSVEIYHKVARLQPALLDQLDLCDTPVWAAKEFVHFSAEDQDCFAKDVLEVVQFSANDLASAGKWLCDLVRSSGGPLSNYLKQNGLLAILAEETRDFNTKRSEFMAVLKSLRHPRYAKYKHRIEEMKKDLLPANSGLRVEIPQFLEQQGFEIKINARDEKTLKNALETLRRKHEALNSLFDIML